MSALLDFPVPEWHSSCLQQQSVSIEQDKKLVFDLDIFSFNDVVWFSFSTNNLKKQNG